MKCQRWGSSHPPKNALHLVKSARNARRKSLTKMCITKMPEETEKSKGQFQVFLEAEVSRQEESD